MSIRVLGAVAVLVAGCGGVDGQDTAAVDPVVLAQGKQTFRHVMSATMSGPPPRNHDLNRTAIVAPRSRWASRDSRHAPRGVQGIAAGSVSLNTPTRGALLKSTPCGPKVTVDTVGARTSSRGWGDLRAVHSTVTIRSPRASASASRWPNRDSTPRALRAVAWRLCRAEGGLHSWGRASTTPASTSTASAGPVIPPLRAAGGRADHLHRDGENIAYWYRYVGVTQMEATHRSRARTG